MKQGVTIPWIVTGNTWFKHLLVKVGAGPLHRPNHRLVPFYPGNIVRPTTAFHVKSVILFLELSNDLVQLLRILTGLQSVPDFLLEKRLQSREIRLLNPDG